MSEAIRKLLESLAHTLETCTHQRRVMLAPYNIMGSFKIPDDWPKEQLYEIDFEKMPIINQTKITFYFESPRGTRHKHIKDKKHV